LLLRNYLDAKQYHTTLKTNGKEALESFLSSTYDICILDIMMPKDEFTRQETNFGRTTGLVLLEKLREISKDIPIIVLTALRDQNVEAKAKNWVLLNIY
jgi:CheY-like chemotaxis protein